jgi:hypothetical protein
VKAQKHTNMKGITTFVLVAAAVTVMMFLNTAVEIIFGTVLITGTVSVAASGIKSIKNRIHENFERKNRMDEISSE